MAIQKPEWFPMDPAKFLSDAVVDVMTAQELGAAFRLLCRQWIDGSLPDDLHLLARLSRLDDAAMAEAWVVLEKFFPTLEPGKRANRFLWIKRESVIADLERKSDEGSRLARKRWDAVRATRIQPASVPDAVRNADGIAPRMPHAMPDAMQEQTRAEQTRPEQKDPPLPPGNGKPKGSPAEFNATEVAVALCQREGWSGKIPPNFADAIRHVAAGRHSADFKAIGEDLVLRWREHKATNRFPHDPGTFFSGGHYETAALPPKTTPRSVADILREQREGVAALDAENGQP